VRRDGTTVVTYGTGVEQITYPTGKKVYRVRVDYPGAAGERKTEARTFGRKKDAEDWRDQHRPEGRRGTFVPTSNVTVAELFDSWIASMEARPSPPKARTIVEYRRTIDHDIIPAIGALPAQQVDKKTIMRFDAALREGNATNDKLRRCHKRLRQAFDFAIDMDIRESNPVPVAKRGANSGAMQEPPVVLSGIQVQRFLEVATMKVPDRRGRDHHVSLHNPLWLLLLQTGLRRGEALGLRWGDLDLEKSQLFVRQSLEVLNNRPHITTPKSRAAYRIVTLFAESVAALKEHRKSQVERQLAAPVWEEHDLVFTNGAGGPLDPNNVLRGVYTIIRTANRMARCEEERLPDFHIHSLRHTHCTQLLVAGWPVITVSRRMGHESPAITMRLYAHALSDMPEGAIVTPAALAFGAVV